MKKVYISGGITNVPDYVEKFKKIENILIAEGYKPVNPVELNHDHDKSWNEFMKVDLKALLDCDMIYMMYGWNTSRGAIIEHNLAREVGIKELKF